jgi:hypothetical protein
MNADLQLSHFLPFIMNNGLIQAMKAYLNKKELNCVGVFRKRVWGTTEMHRGFWWRNLWNRDHLEDGVYGVKY